MKIKKFVHKNVGEDGSFTININGKDEPCEIKINGFISTTIGESINEEGNFTDGYKIFITLPRMPDGVVEQVTVEFNDMKEVYEFLMNKELEMT